MTSPTPAETAGDCEVCGTPVALADPCLWSDETYPTHVACVAALELTRWVWAGDLAYHSTAVGIWATGQDLDNTDPRVRQAGDINDWLIETRGELERRAGHWAATPLAGLAAALDATGADHLPVWVVDSIHAAAALRVLDNDMHSTDAEALQPGRELPAVGIYALLTD